MNKNEYINKSLVIGIIIVIISSLIVFTFFIPTKQIHTFSFTWKSNNGYIREGFNWFSPDMTLYFENLTPGNNYSLKGVIDFTPEFTVDIKNCFIILNKTNLIESTSNMNKWLIPFFEMFNGYYYEIDQLIFTYKDT